MATFYKYPSKSEWGADGCLYQFDYDVDLVAKIKEIPTAGRKWIKEQKAWWIADQYEEIVKRIFADPCYDPINDLYGHNFGPGGGNVQKTALGRMHLIEGTPEVVIRAVYKALIAVYHPSGGTMPNEEKMKEVNGAFEALVKANGWRK